MIFGAPERKRLWAAHYRPRFALLPTRCRGIDGSPRTAWLQRYHEVEIEMGAHKGVYRIAGEGSEQWALEAAAYHDGRVSGGRA